MPNIKSAKKALRSSLRKKQYNTLWKSRIKESIRTLDESLENKKADVDILNKELSVLQKVLDKAAKNHVIHRNKANRLKSRYAEKITALDKGKNTTKRKKDTKGSKTGSGKKS